MNILLAEKDLRSLMNLFGIQGTGHLREQGDGHIQDNLCGLWHQREHHQKLGQAGRSGQSSTMELRLHSGAL